MSLTITRTETLFPTPLIILKLDDAVEMNARLIEEFVARKAGEPAIARSNVGGWHSSPDFFRRTEAGHRQLAGHLVKSIMAATRQLAPDATLSDLDLIVDGWVNVSPAGSYHSPHSHPGAFWSGVYYVDVPGRSDPQSRSGAIEFLSPRGSSPDWSMLPSAMTGDSFSVQPEEGMILLFPGYVQHWVHPHAGERDRVCVAFNAKFSRKPKG